MDWRSRITVQPGKRDGKPCIRGLRITITDVLEHLASGMTRPSVTSPTWCSRTSTPSALLRPTGNAPPPRLPQRFLSGLEACRRGCSAGCRRRRRLAIRRRRMRSQRRCSSRL